MKIVFILMIFLCSCSNNLENRSLIQLNNMTDWNKAYISKRASIHFKDEAKMFEEQKLKDFKIITEYPTDKSLENNLMSNWDLLIHINNQIYKNRLIGVIQTQKRKVILNELKVLKSEINKEIEVKYVKKNSL